MYLTFWKMNKKVKWQTYNLNFIIQQDVSQSFVKSEFFTETNSLSKHIK